RQHLAVVLEERAPLRRDAGRALEIVLEQLRDVPGVEPGGHPQLLFVLTPEEPLSPRRGLMWVIHASGWGPAHGASAAARSAPRQPALSPIDPGPAAWRMPSPQA